PCRATVASREWRSCTHRRAPTYGQGLPGREECLHAGCCPADCAPKVVSRLHHRRDTRRWPLPGRHAEAPVCRGCCVPCPRFAGRKCPLVFLLQPFVLRPACVDTHSPRPKL